MKTIFADFNAMTEADHVRLTCQGSDEDIRRAGVEPGDRVWLSDGEVLVGARLETEPYYGLVGVPSWKTLVHLTDGKGPPFGAIVEEIRELHDRPLDTSPDGGARIFRLLTLFERNAPEELMSLAPPGWLARKRAIALTLMQEPELALDEARRALTEAPDDARALGIYLELLRVNDLPAASREVGRRAQTNQVDAMVLAVCIDILATEADRLPDEELEGVAARLHDLVARFESSSGRGAVSASTLARVYFNVGFIALRRGNQEEAHRFLRRAALTDPTDSVIGRAASLVDFDQTARDLVHAVHSRLTAA